MLPMQNRGCATNEHDRIRVPTHETAHRCSAARSQHVEEAIFLYHR